MVWDLVRREVPSSSFVDGLVKRTSVEASRTSGETWIVGFNPSTTPALLSRLQGLVSEERVISASTVETVCAELTSLDLLVVATDKYKVDLIREIGRHISTFPKVCVYGVAHQEFDDDLLRALTAESLVPSIANGNDNTLAHLIQALNLAKKHDLDGDIVEFGTYRGGTAWLLGSYAAKIGLSGQVTTFDQFGPFPPRRSLFDTYDTPESTFANEGAVRRYLEGEQIEVVRGDIVDTVNVLVGRPIALAFIDTDNFTVAKRVLEVVCSEVQIFGSIVLDHFHTVERFSHTVGERVAALDCRSLDDFFNVHGTGLFVRL